MRLILIWCCNALALIAVTHVVPGVQVAGFGSALIAALVLGLINALIRPVLLLLTLPVTVLSLGLFILVINGLLFWFAGSVLRGFEVSGFGAGMLGALLYSIISYLLLLLVPPKTGKPQPPRDGPITIDHDKH